MQGVCYKITHNIKLNTQLNLHIAKLILNTDSNDVFEVQCALMAKEIDSMAHLKHPNLVRYLACEREGNVFRIFQEYV